MNTSKPTTTTESKLSEQIEAVENKLNENSLAWEMLKEQKRTIKRLFTTIFVLIAFLFVIIAGVLGTTIYLLNNYDFSDTQSIEYTQDGTGNNIIGNGNEVNN